MKRIFFITAFLSIIGLSGLSYAEIYQWTDENGAVHFSDSPVDLRDKEEVEVMGEVESPPTFYDEMQEDSQRQIREEEREERRQIREEENEKWLRIQESKEAEAKAKEERLMRKEKRLEAEAEAKEERLIREEERKEKRHKEKMEAIEDIERDVKKMFRH